MSSSLFSETAEAFCVMSVINALSGLVRSKCMLDWELGVCVLAWPGSGGGKASIQVMIHAPTNATAAKISDLLNRKYQSVNQQIVSLLNSNS